MSHDSLNLARFSFKETFPGNLNATRTIVTVVPRKLQSGAIIVHLLPFEHATRILPPLSQVTILPTLFLLSPRYSFAHLLLV